MMRKWGNKLAMFGILMAAGSASQLASAQEETKKPALEPVTTIEVSSQTETLQEPKEPPPIPKNNRRLLEMREYYEGQCGKDGPVADVGLAGEKVRVKFADDIDGYPVLAICIDRHHLALAHTLGNIKDGLVVLAAKKLEPLWPLAEQKMGNDLGKLRKHIGRDRFRVRASNNTYSSMVNGSTARAMNNAGVLASIGQVAEAKAELQERIDWITKPNKKRARSRSYDLAMLGIRYAGVIAVNEGSGPAARYLEKYIAETPLHKDEMVNMQINLAAYQAEDGKYEQALATLTPAWADFRNVNPYGELYQISGSDREFSWIFACAHQRMGNADLAKPFIETVESAKEEPTDRYISRVKRSVFIKFRMYRCMDDADGYFETWESRTPGFLDIVWLDFQEGIQDFRTTGILRDWVMNDERAREISSEFRQLPEAFQPALRTWRPEKPTAE